MTVFGPYKRRAKGRRNKAKFASKLRRCQTGAELRLWTLLKPEKFKCQVVIFGYIADFAHPKARLIVEADGEYHNAPDQMERDRLRDWHLYQHGYKVLRFSNKHIFDDPNGVFESIMAAMPSRYARLPKSSVQSSSATHASQPPSVQTATTGFATGSRENTALGSAD